ncbi:phenylalanine--tRNA ligase subunit alpha [Fodinisporobacter ferrooxydans]|uniref:Phenylalanine--tRNA ligase alpha subunit n=1 Tax=Fodinisporobacter ferrooxydans TaxID=2901836 RepID=A0ABY4CQT8_9BACL|nr:phenylalanine--tRNA ligase subunit alpha [Alicyclobacillaceae bacterium MYW30-H2]
MQQQLQELRQQALREIKSIKNLQNLQEWKVRYLGKKGLLTQVLRSMGELPADERPLMGQLVNEVRGALEQELAASEQKIKQLELNNRLNQEWIDVTLPGRRQLPGTEHPLLQVIREIEDIFVGLGFEIAEGPEVETDYYNFEALNLPKDHPARDMQDTFYITEELLMRTHTSPVQARTLERKKPDPLRIICPGRVYRRDEDDATHSHAFNQVEGLVVDKGIRMSDLKGVLLTFARQMFGGEQKIRLRPSFFPFTEPSAEVDVSCIICKGAGCRVCKHTGWLEILGSGMVHPKVLEMGGYDSDVYTGFAFGMGVERIAMLKYGIDDIRHFYVNDVRFLRQFTARR